MQIFVLGNQDMGGDDVAVRLLPKLKKQFPKIKFNHIDPLEGLEANLICRTSDDGSIRSPFRAESRNRRIYDNCLNAKDEKIIIIDAVKGISKVKRFDDLGQFVSAHKRLTMHDFDLYDELILLQKLKKLPKIAIIGLPWGVKDKKIFKETSIIIKQMVF